jgi:hypothetical protein
LQFRLPGQKGLDATASNPHDLRYSKLHFKLESADHIVFDLNTILENLSAIASIAAKDKTIGDLCKMPQILHSRVISD